MNNTNTVNREFPMKEKPGLKIYKGTVKVKNGVYDRFTVDIGVINGKRQRQTFATEPEAEAYCKEYLKQHEIWLEKQKILKRRIGQDAKRLDNSSLRQTAEAIGQLKGGATIQDAVKFFIEHSQAKGGNKTVQAVYDEYIPAKRAANRRERSIGDMIHYLALMLNKFGKRPVNSITTADLEESLNSHRKQNGKQCHPATRAHFRRIWMGFFNYALKKKYVHYNPVDAIEAPTIDETIPRIFKPKQIEKLMQAALKEDKNMIPYFAICAFAGIRPSEAQQLNWSWIDLEAKRITIPPEIAKKRRQRYVDISDNLLSWLSPYHRNSGLVFYSRKSFDKIKTGFDWSPDILRHSYGSYHLAEHDDAALTSMQMGHRNTDVLFNHYRQLVKREEAAAFWKIRPEQEKQEKRESNGLLFGSKSA